MCLHFVINKVCVLVIALGLSSAALSGKSGNAEPAEQVKSGTAQAPALTKDQDDAERKQLGLRLDRYGDPLPDGAFARLGTVRFRHVGAMTTGVAFAAGGKVIVSTGGRGDGVYLWDATTGRPVQRILAGGICFGLAVSADGKLALTDSLILIDVAAGKEIRRLEPQLMMHSSVAFSPDGRTVAAGEFQKQAPITLWDITTGLKLRTLEAHTDYVTRLVFSPDGETLASAGSQDKTVRLWDVASGRQIRQLQPDGKYVSDVAFAPGGRLLATAGQGGAIQLWNVTTGKRERQFKGIDNAVYRVAFSHDGTTLASVGTTSSICFWDPETGKELRRWVIDTNGYFAFSPDSKVIASISGTNAIRRWDATSGKETDPVIGHTAPVESLQFNANGKSLVSRCRTAVLEWDLTTGGDPRQLFDPSRGPSPERWTGSVGACSPDGRVLVLPFWLIAPGNVAEAKQDPVLHLWDAVARKELHALVGHDEAATCTFSPDGKLLASGGKDGVCLWDVLTGKKLHQIQERWKGRPALAFSPDSKWLAFLAVDNAMSLWDIVGGKEIRHWESGLKSMAKPVFSPDGNLIACVGTNVRSREIRVWSTTTGKELQRFGFQSNVELGSTSLAFSPSGRLLAFGERETQKHPGGGLASTYKIRLGEVLTGQDARQITSSQCLATSLAFSPDGRALASGGDDSAILLWDLTVNVQGGNAKPAALTANALDALWADLAGDASAADRAIWAFTLAPKVSMPFLKDRLRTSAPADPQQIAKLIAELDDNRFAARQKAVQSLDALGGAAETALRKELKGTLTLETRQRIQQILEKRDKEAIQKLRAMEAVEQIGDAETRQVLEALAHDAPNPRVADAASAALKRLAKR